MKLITLLTDFGTRDGYPGIMKGVIWTITPDAEIVDITHDIAPQNILEGALTLARTVPYYPPGTVHIAVIDPGVGTARRPIAARAGESFLVGPDNGLFSFLLQKAWKEQAEVEIVHLDQPRYWLPDVSSSFHGRDIFAPAGAHLARGVPLSELGTPIKDPVLISLPAPRRGPTGWHGEVVHIDSFGNLSTNLDRSHLPSSGAIAIRIADQTIQALSHSFGDGHPGDLVAFIDSSGKLAVAVVNGSAARRLQAGIGQPVELLEQEPSRESVNDPEKSGNTDAF